MKILSFSGKSGAGKDTAANIIVDKITREGKTCTRLSFAKPIKDICSNIFGWDRELLNYDPNYKESNTLPSSPELDPACDMLGMTRREIMQKMGTECFRDGLHPDFWIMAMKLSILRGDYSSCDYGIITDCRFMNEINFVKEMNGILIRIDRIGDSDTLTDKNSHKSEQEWQQWKHWDLIFENYIDVSQSQGYNIEIMTNRLLQQMDNLP